MPNAQGKKGLDSLIKNFGSEFLMKLTLNALPAHPFYHKMWREKKCGLYKAVYGINRHAIPKNSPPIG